MDGARWPRASMGLSTVPYQGGVDPAQSLCGNGRSMRRLRSSCRPGARLIESAGIILYRHRRDGVEIFLIHMGGPIWKGRDAGAWSIPKGIIGPREGPLTAAKREFQEETGYALEGEFKPLGRFRQNSGKYLSVWAVEGDCDPARMVSQSFSMIWPPKSGKRQQYPEADRGNWFEREAALVKVVKGQRAVIEHFYEAVRAWN